MIVKEGARIMSLLDGTSKVIGKAQGNEWLLVLMACVALRAVDDLDLGR